MTNLDKLLSITDVSKHMVFTSIRRRKNTSKKKHRIYRTAILNLRCLGLFPSSHKHITVNTPGN